MRRYLSPEPRRRFNVAWRLMPTVVQDALEPYLRPVEERENLEGEVYRWKGREVRDPRGRARLRDYRV